MDSSTTNIVPSKGSKPASCGDCGTEFLSRSKAHVYCRNCSNLRAANRKRKWEEDHPRKITSEQKRKWNGTRKSKAVARGLERNKSGVLGVTWHAQSSPRLVWRACFAIPYGQEVSKNHVYRANGVGHVELREQQKRYKSMVAERTRSAVSQHEVVQGKVWIDVLVQKPNFKSDAINVLDKLMDGVKEGLGIDDRWFCIRRLDWQIVKTQPHIIIGIGQEKRTDRLGCSHCGKLLRIDRFGPKKGGRMDVDRACKKCLKG